jgi:hypothetical protein
MGRSRAGKQRASPRSLEMLFFIAGIDLAVALAFVTGLIWWEALAAVLDPDDRIPTIGV